ncbi:hypothetical protein AG0111_0g12973 [Alternaria gaisen]|uniref:Uncharacterized protein n=1 Tax=Alternaria gaisen TaxID=167740 RepID=A0ACB6F2V1_9PLEO|nr:hypothetical protein AG0111_0g12973 [Alternaria gaisen]
MVTTTRLFSQQREHERTDSNETAEKPTHEKAKDIVQTIISAAEWAIAAMSYAQQEQERQANKARKPALLTRLEIGLFDLRDVRTTRASKKQTGRARNTKCHAYETPTG